ncbi:MAG: DUF2569 family protein [Ignavibacteriae bacterium]|nr:DUF2569 family protein [Ignavibacteriota bacterium]
MTFEESCKEKIGGWLIFLYINLFVLGVYNILTGVGYLFYMDGTNLDRYFYEGIIFSLISIIIGLYSFYCGYNIFKKDKNAIRTTKKFLIFYISIYLITGIYYFLDSWLNNSLMSSNFLETLFYQIIFQLPKIIFFLIWYLYLTYSKRVKYTFNVV